MNRSIALLIVLCSAVPLEARCQSTAEDRATLFDYILAKTMEREAFSPAKNHALAFDVEEAMLRYRDEFVADVQENSVLYRHVNIAVDPEVPSRAAKG